MVLRRVGTIAACKTWGKAAKRLFRAFLISVSSGQLFRRKLALILVASMATQVEVVPQ